MALAYCVVFRSIVILQQYSGAGSKYETCVTMAHRILNIPLISTTILALNTAYDHLLMYKLYLSSFGLLFDVNEFVPGLIQVVV
jgi:hypothetical protein